MGRIKLELDIPADKAVLRVDDLVLLGMKPSDIGILQAGAADAVNLNYTLSAGNSAAITEHAQMEAAEELENIGARFLALARLVRGGIERIKVTVT